MNKLEQQHLPIGVFDSGVGGLSVLKVLKEQFPHEHFIYIGDNKNNPVPFGRKYSSVLYRYSCSCHC